MRDLIVELSTVGGCAEDALRVIDHFDTLVDQRASALALLRAAAALADCPVGFDDPERGMCVGVDAGGRAMGAVSGVGAGRQARRFAGTTVWLERDGEPWPLDALLLERFARSLHAVKSARDTSPRVAAMRVVCDPGASAGDRERALRQLGLGATVAVVATRADEPGEGSADLVVDAHRIRLLPGSTRVPGPAGAAAGVHVCAAAAVPFEWQRACVALRIAVDAVTGAPMHVHYADLGSIATVVESVDAADAAASPDVLLVAELQAQRPWVVPTLALLHGHASVREVARLQNLHHSTLRQRIDWLARNLGFDPLSGDGLARTGAMLTLWRIAAAAGPRCDVATAGTAVAG